jgi:uncharacterized protein (TIGR00251 family)
LKIRVKVKPNARENSIIELEGGYYEVKVTAPPEKGKANARVIEMLSKHLKVPKSKITLISGETFKEKVFEIGDQ